MAALLELSGITKRYPGVIANDGVDLDIQEGEIAALLGENGAGKSTLVKIVYGLVQPDAGTLRWQGTPVRIASPKAARRLGIGMVFQHFSLFEALTVLENVALGLDDPPGASALRRQVQEVSAAYGLPLEPDKPVHALSVGERQRIEIVRALLQNPKVLIMDEPTSVLTPQEVGRLFETLRAIAAEGRAVLYISHKLEEVRSLCERATVLRHGRVVARVDARAETAASLARAMIGEDIRLAASARQVRLKRAPLLLVEGLSLPAGEPHAVPLARIGLDVQRGEILGIAGVAGNGQRELALALSGERPAAKPSMIRFDGRPIGDLGPDARRKAGLCTLPEERNGIAAVATFSLAENAVLGAWRRAGLARGGVVRTAKARAFTAEIIETFDVRTRGPDAAAASLSGGNLQKFVLGREVLQEPLALIAAQPTWGVDAGAAARIHRALRQLAEAGSAVVVISQDLDEILSLCDRLAVLNAGRLSRAVPTAGVSVEQIGLLMGGLHDLPAAGEPVAPAP